MPVFNTAANTIYADPVSSFYEGKAMRIALKNQELANEMAQTEIDQAPDRLAIDRQNTETNAQKAGNAALKNQIDLAKLEREAGKEAVDAMIESFAGGMAVYDETGDEEQAYEATVTKLAAIDPDTDPEEARQILDESMGGAFNPETVGAFLMTADEYRQRGREKTPGSLTNMYNPKTGERGSFRANSPEADQRAAEGWLTGSPASNGTEFERVVEQLDLPPEEKQALLLAYAQNKAGMGGEGNVRSQKIRDLTRMVGDEDLAIKIVDGHLKMDQNPVTGMVELTDVATGEAWEVPVSGDQKVVASPEPGQTLWDLSEFATGPSSGVQAAYSVPAAWMGLPVPHKVIQARQTFRTTGQNLVRALAVNPRFPVTEQERIREEIALLPALLDSPELMRSRMASIAHDLDVRATQAENDAKDTSLSRDTRSKQSANANEIRNYLALMGIPEGVRAGGRDAPKAAIDYLKKNPSAAPQFKEKYGYLPEGFNE